jgi:glycerol-3-phosphate responsive antiterminator
MEAILEKLENLEQVLDNAKANIGRVLDNTIAEVSAIKEDLESKQKTFRIYTDYTTGKTIYEDLSKK